MKDSLSRKVMRGYRPRRPTSDWFSDLIKRSGAGAGVKISEQKALTKAKSTRISSRDIGKLYFYRYDPKWKKELPYYDRLPIIFPFALRETGFLGINLHYLPPILRAKLMDALLNYRNNGRFNEKTRLKITYSILAGASKLRFFKPCVKQYLNKHVRSMFLEIPPTEWEEAVFLLPHDFRKATYRKVWSDSRKMLGV